MAKIALASYDPSLFRELVLELAENHQVEEVTSLPGLQKLIGADADLIVMTVQLDLGGSSLTESFEGTFTGFALALHLRTHGDNTPVILVSNFLELPDALARLPFVEMYDGLSSFDTPQGTKNLIFMIDRMLTRAEKA